MPRFEGITENDVKTLIAIYRGAEKEIIDSVKGADIASRPAKAALLAQIQGKLAELVDPTNEFIDIHAIKEYQTGIELVDSAFFRESFSLVDDQALIQLIDSAKSQIKTALGTSLQHIETLANRLTREAGQQAIEETGKALILGRSRKELSKRFAQILTDNGITGYTYSDKNGKQYNVSLEAYVDSMARSTLRDARITAISQRTIENGGDLVKVTSHPNPSPLCSPWQGKILSVSGKTEGYPTLQEAINGGKGLFHRYCRHSINPYNPTDIKFN